MMKAQVMMKAVKTVVSMDIEFCWSNCLLSTPYLR
jgi:hypothetical protein